MRVATITLLLAFTTMCATRRTCRRYKYFDDYLSHCDFGFFHGRGEGWSTDMPLQEPEGSGDVHDSPIPSASVLLPYRSGLRNSKKEMCCILGTIAGDKGYHCYVEFYLRRILMRNRNRAHNRKIDFSADREVIKSRTKLMKTFEKCVAGRGKIFHKCCHVATMKIPDFDHYDSQQMLRYKSKMESTKNDK